MQGRSFIFNVAGISMALMTADNQSRNVPGQLSLKTIRVKEFLLINAVKGKKTLCSVVFIYTWGKIPESLPEYLAEYLAIS